MTPAARPLLLGASTTIEFDIAREAPVSLRVHDVTGRLMRTLIDGATQPAGRQRASWDGHDAEGRPAPAGIYLITLDAGGIRDHQRVARLR